MRIITLALLCILHACAVTPDAGRWGQRALDASAFAPQGGLSPQSRTAAKPASATKANSVRLLIGQQNLDEEAWAPTDELRAIGIGYAHEAPDSPVGFEVGLQLAQESEEAFVSGLGIVDFSVENLSFSVGVRRTLLRDRMVQPFIGAGLEIASVTAEGVFGSISVEDDDVSPGVYLHGGVMVWLGEAARIGIDGRIVRGTDVTLFGAEGDVDYEQLGVFLAFVF